MASLSLTVTEYSSNQPPGPPPPGGSSGAIAGSSLGGASALLPGYNLESNIGSFQGLQCAQGTVTTQVVAILKELTLKSFFKNKKGYDWLIDAKEQNTIG